MKILNAHAEAVETQFAEGFKVFAAGDAGVDLDADFSVGGEFGETGTEGGASNFLQNRTYPIM